MFTGLVEAVGTVRSLSRSGQYARLTIAADRVLRDLDLGDSISIDGVCQTVVSRHEGGFSVDCLAATLAKTTLGSLRPGQRVNLERALRADSRLGGHIVQGHVGGVGRVVTVHRDQKNTFLVVDLPAELAFECVLEGSIAIHGVSLTIVEVTGHRVTVNVIPETLGRTNLGGLESGDSVNIETDILGRYVRAMVGAYRPAARDHGDRSATTSAGANPIPGALSAEQLSRWGYIGEST